MNHIAKDYDLLSEPLIPLSNEHGRSGEDVIRSQLSKSVISANNVNFTHPIHPSDRSAHIYCRQVQV